MTSKRLRLIAVVGAALLLAGCGASSSSSSGGGTPSAAVSACGSSARGSDAAIAACVQGYNGAVAGKTLHSACLLGTGAVTAVENVRDCSVGFLSAPAGPRQSATPVPSAAALADCAGTDRTSPGSIAACVQGYDDADADQASDYSCDHLGSGAVLTVENAQDCLDGWLVAKGEDDLIPGEQT